MGKNRDIASLIRVIANVVVHEIVAEHTNKPESAHSLNSEVIEYRSKAERASEEYQKHDEAFVLWMLKEQLIKFLDITGTTKTGIMQKRKL